MFIIPEWCINQFLPSPQYWVLINKVIRMCSPVEMAEDGKSEKPGVRPASTAAPGPGPGWVAAPPEHGLLRDRMEITRTMSTSSVCNERR